MRRDTGRDFWAYQTRGAGGGGHSVWTIGSFLGSFGARWLDGEGIAIDGLRTPQGTVRAQRVLLAGNVYLHGVAPQLEPRIMPVGTYIIATEPLGEARITQLMRENVAVTDINFVLDYFRFSADHRMLFGGRVSYTTRTPVNLQALMRQRMGEAAGNFIGFGAEWWFNSSTYGSRR